MGSERYAEGGLAVLGPAQSSSSFLGTCGVEMSLAVLEFGSREGDGTQRLKHLRLCEMHLGISKGKI